MRQRGVWAIPILVGLVGAAWYVLVVWPMRDPHPAPRAAAEGALAIRDARIWISPDAPPLEHATVLVRDGAIAQLGRQVPVPGDARVVACGQPCTVTAGFWNTHVHFTEPKWNAAPRGSAATLDAQLADMLLSRGFTTVVDAGSDLRLTLSLRRRIEAGDLAGPAIYTAGAPLYPPHGVPYYLRNTLPFWLLWFMPQPATPGQAARLEERNIARGADVLKLFTGSWVERGKVLPMPEPIARAAVEVAHRHGQLAYSHASNLEGTRVAISSGVDILAHAPDSPEGIDEGLLRSMVKRGMAMVPTLKMFATTVTTRPAYLEPIYAIVRQFHGLGGQLLFGTDVGYMTDYRTEDEFQALAGCGLEARDILRMLTSEPAARFGVADRKGTLAPGKLADLVVLDGDPSSDIAAFARVRATVRGGRVVYTAAGDARSSGHRP